MNQSHKIGDLSNRKSLRILLTAFYISYLLNP
jgi:hypothetical protein